jgi:hypothetical protein
MRLTPLLLLLALCGCLAVSFRRPQTLEESLKERGLRDYYLDVKNAFALGDAQALAALFDPAIAKPMTRAQVLAWGNKFFAEHGAARFHVEKLEVLELGYRHGLTRLTYKVETKSGKGDFGGVELDTFTRRSGRWLMTSWEKVP